MTLRSLVLVLFMCIERFDTVASQTVSLDSSCPQDWVETNSVTCICKIVGDDKGDNDDVEGTPAWYDDSGQEIVTEVVGTLIVKRTSDISKKQFQCRAKLKEGQAPNEVHFTPKFAYTPEITLLEVNHESSILIVLTNVTVTFECEAKGGPLPTLVVRGKKWNSVVQLSEKASPGNGVRRSIGTKLMECVDTDVYACAATNRFGRTNKSVSVFVKCEPQYQSSFNHTIGRFVATNQSALNIRIPITGYPPPHQFILTRLGTQGAIYKVHQYNVTLQQSSPSESVVVLSITSLKEHANGYYVLNINNGMGSGLDYTFLFIEGKQGKATELAVSGFANSAAHWIGLAGFVVVYSICFMAWKKDKMTDDDDVPAVQQRRSQKSSKDLTFL